MSDRDVLITGLGVISPIGVGGDAVWESVTSGRSGVRMLPHLESAGWLAPFGGNVVDFEPKELIQPRKSIKVMCREIQFASAAAEMAWQDAGLANATIDPERFGVIGAAGVLYCDLEELRIPFLEWLKQEDFDIHRWSRKAMGELYPLWMLKYLPNMPACHIGIRYDARGPNNTISLGEVSSMLALAEAAEVIRRGHADIMIVGGTGSRLNVMDFVWHGDARLGMNGKLPPSRVSRPFDAKRCGMVYGEGAAELVLESRAHAKARRARPIARVAGTASRYETVAEGLKPTGDSIARAMRAALALADVSPRDIGHVNAHGMSTREDDAAEAKAIRGVLGDVSVSAPKSFFGNLGPGSGMVELVVSLIGMQQEKVPQTINYEVPDPECPVNVVTKVQPARSPAFMKLTHNSAGQAVAVVVTKD